MARYPILVGTQEDLEVTIGYDPGYCGFFLNVVAVEESQHATKRFLFNHITDHPGIVMTISEIKEVLMRFGISLHREDVRRLVNDADAHQFEKNVLCAFRFLAGTNEQELDDFRRVKKRYRFD